MSTVDTAQWTLYADPEGFIHIRFPATWSAYTTRVRSERAIQRRPQPTHVGASTKEIFTFAPCIDVMLRKDPGRGPSPGVHIRCIHAPKPWSFFYSMGTPNMLLGGTIPAYHADDEDAPWIVETPRAHYELWCWPPGPFPHDRAFRPYDAAEPAPIPPETLHEWAALTTTMMQTFTPGPSSGWPPIPGTSAQ